MEKHINHTQQISAEREVTVLNDNERPLYHKRTETALGSVAAGECSSFMERPLIRTISREEVLLQEAQAARFEQDRVDIVDAAYKAQGKLKTSLIEQPTEVATNPALFLDKDGQLHNN